MEAEAVNQNLEFHDIHGAQLGPWLDRLGLLRVRVFREFPYLYDGSPEYEREYLKAYAESPGSLVVLVTGPGEEVMGATTCIPLADQSREFQEPFLRAGYEPGTVVYFGESILVPELRGLGIGKEFFRRREEHARKLGVRWTVFCAVDREPGHPREPAGYRPLDEFWISRGYRKDERLKSMFSWKEIGEETDSPKSLTFWTRDWGERTGD